MRNICRVAVFACVPALLWAENVPRQQPANRFTFTVGGAANGVEEFTIEKTASGHRLTGTVRFEQGGAKFELRHESVYTAEWSPSGYTLEVSAAGQPQSLAATRTGDELHLKGGGGGQTRTGTVAVRPRSIVLDNTIFSHYQALLDAAGPGGPVGEWWVVVPQAFMGLAGKVSSAGDQSGVLDGKPVALKKFALELGPVLVEFWAEAGTNRLMRVTVPVQKVEAVREGFALQSAVPAAAAPALPPGVTERTLTYPSGTFQMPGTLAQPAQAAGRLPAVVFVHGSGPNDRDETIGPNKPFRDLAHGLAGAGIASLRYDKRTFAFRDRLDPQITVEEEVLQDAVAALEYVRGLPEVDGARVFLLGHSLGATLAPFIAQRAPWVRGVVMLAPAMRPLDEVVVAQTRDRLRDMGQSEAEIAAKVEELQKQFARVRSGEAPDTERVLGASARYWRDLRKRDIAAALAGLTTPVLVLQGAEDIQVTKADYALVQRALAGEPATEYELHWLSGLNHLFMRTEGRSTGAEYGRASQVDPEVIRLIGEWMRKQAPR